MISFGFSASGFSEIFFSVVDFHGKEAMSELYSFEITLNCKDGDVDLRELLVSTCYFTIVRDNQDKQNFHGVVSRLEVLSKAHGLIYIKLELVPRLWGLTLGVGSQIFLDKTIPEIIQEVLKDREKNNVLPSYKFILNADYPVREYVCQYNESAFNFISRLMENEGVYYYFEQNDKEEVLCVCDNLVVHNNKNDDSTLTYSPASGLEGPIADEVLNNFVSCEKRLPAETHLKGFDYQKPNLLPEGKATISDTGVGTVYSYGENFTSQAEGDRLAKVHANQLLCQGCIHHGESSAPWLQPGFIFNLEEHFLASVNREYIVSSIVHEGNQAGYLTHGLDDKLQNNHMRYQNYFSCIPATVQYRSPRITPRPKIAGVVSAWIDSAGNGQHAMLDDEGRYKVLLPFDLSGRADGKASHWIRMAQPYGGQEHGMHFPLLHNTEVLLAFIEGDPDRPVIQATVPNPHNPSLVNNSNNTVNRIKTSSGTEIIMDDTVGKERITFMCQGAMISLGKVE